MKLFIFFITIFFGINSAEAGMKKFVVAGLSHQAVLRVIVPAIVEGKGIDSAIKIASKFKKSKLAKDYIYYILSVYIISETNSDWAKNAADIIIGAGLNDSSFERKINAEMANFQSHVIEFTYLSELIDSRNENSYCLNKNLIYNQNITTPFYKINKPVLEWDYGSYRELLNSAVFLDMIDNDHIPSSAAVLTYLSKRDNKTLNKKIDLGYNVHYNATSLAVANKLHRQSRTYKGRNKSLIIEDAKNLKLATIKDFSYYFASSKKLNKQMIDSFISIYSRNKYLCLYGEKK